MSKHWKGLAAVMVVVAALLVLIATVCFWAQGDILNSHTFGTKATRALTSEASRAAIASATVDALLADRPILHALVRNPAKQAVSNLLASPLLGDDSTTKLSSQLHRLVTKGDIPSMVIRMDYVREVVATVVSLFDEKAGAHISERRLNEDVNLILLEDIPQMQSYLVWAPLIGTLAILVSAALFLVGLWKSPQRSSTLLVAGSTLGLAALVLMIIIPSLDSLVTGAASRHVAKVLLAELYNVFSVGLQWRLGVVMATGATAAAIALWLQTGSRPNFSWIGRSWQRMWRRARRPGRE